MKSTIKSAQKGKPGKFGVTYLVAKRKVCQYLQVLWEVE